MTMNVWYDDKKNVFVMYYLGKRYERATAESLAELITTELKEQRLDALYV